MSGGHYPPSYHHIQPPQEYIAPRHRLPVIPPQGPPSSTIAHAHSSPTTWINKHNFPNFHDSSSFPRNYSSSARSYYNEESNWSEPVSLTNPLYRGNSNDKIRNNYTNDVQQESMDLSSAAHVPPVTSPKRTPETTPVPVNGSPATEPEELPNGTPAKTDIPDKEPVSVIASNPLRENPPVRSPKRVESKSPKLNETAEQIKTKNEQSISADRVESILESMFHSDTKSSVSNSSSVIVSTQSCQPSDLRAESVEKILKSPSPERGSDSDTEMNSDQKRNQNSADNSICDITNESGKSLKSSDNHDKSKLPDGKTESTSTVSSDKSNNQCHNIEDDSSIADLSTTHDTTSSKRSGSNTPELCSVKIEPNEPETSKNIDRASDQKSKPNKEVTPKGKNNKEIIYVEVESELEKMFAGIEDIQTDSKLPKVTSGKLSKSNLSLSTPNASYSQPANTTEAPAKPKKKSSKKSKSTSTKKDTKKHLINSKDTSTDNVNFKRVPVIHVQGSKENPINVQIINSIKLEEDDISDAKTAAKRKQGKCDRANKRLAACYSVKNYDPEASDESWICIFCKLSAHTPGLSGEPTGELFGPYFIKNPNQPVIDGDSKRHSRKTDHSTEPIKKKQKRSLSSDSNHTSSISEHKSMEIWAHESCFVWASGVHLVGSKLVGLEEAVIQASHTVCAHCGANGASIGCRARHCKSFVHYSCALYTGWNLDPETFIAVCYLHKGTH